MSYLLLFHSNNGYKTPLNTLPVLQIHVKHAEIMKYCILHKNINLQ